MEDVSVWKVLDARTDYMKALLAVGLKKYHKRFSKEGEACLFAISTQIMNSNIIVNMS